IKDLRAVLGKRFPLIAPDGFSSFSDTYRNSGGVAIGMYISIGGVQNSGLGPVGKAFVSYFGAQLVRTPNPYSAYSAQSMSIVLDAVAASDGTRATVTSNLLATH